MDTTLFKALALVSLVSLTQISPLLAQQKMPPAKELPPAAGVPLDMAPVSKQAIEMPTKNLISLQSRAIATEAEKTRRPDERQGTVRQEGLDGKTVLPGKIAWHKSLSQAIDRSRSSGKPVLLFYMLGRLDKEFC
ncbi:MAG: hypothetical protein IPM93_14185 [Candidatus Obscuribacter sp.]|nr:hypothetical protein [Candidatus Obscuribacter sp.]